MVPGVQDSNVVAIIQARMNSSRLPGKVLKQLGNKTVLEHVIRRCQGFAKQTVVCTSSEDSDDPIESECKNNGVICIRGSLDNVFARFRQTLLDEKVTETSWFARVTADCPLVSTRLALELIENIPAEGGVQYLRHRADALPMGIAIELIHRATFLGIDVNSLDKPEREHVTLRLYEKPGRYQVRHVTPPSVFCRPEYRLTLDYEEDYQLFQELFLLDSEVSAEIALSLLRENPALANINETCVQKNAR